MPTREWTPGFLADVIDGFGRRIESVDAAQWTAPTPCGEWNVHDLVNHVMGEVLWIAPLLEGKTIEEVGDRFDGDVVGADPTAMWRAAREAALAAAGEAGAPERQVHLSSGDAVATAYLGEVTADMIVHSWDLARALGGDDTLEPAFVTFATGILGPLIDSWRGAGVLGPAVEVAADASPQVRLLAQTGRSADWSAG